MGLKFSTEPPIFHDYFKNQWKYLLSFRCKCYEIKLALFYQEYYPGLGKISCPIPVIILTYCGKDPCDWPSLNGRDVAQWQLEPGTVPAAQPASRSRAVSVTSLQPRWLAGTHRQGANRAWCSQAAETQLGSWLAGRDKGVESKFEIVGDSTLSALPASPGQNSTAALHCSRPVQPKSLTNMGFLYSLSVPNFLITGLFHTKFLLQLSFLTASVFFSSLTYNLLCIGLKKRTR